MELIKLADAPPHDPDGIVAQPFVDGQKCNVRAIHLRPGQALPSHTHGDSDLMLYGAEGEGVLDTDAGTVPSPTAPSPTTEARRSCGSETRGRRA